MSYYNDVWIIFARDGELDFRIGGAMLPAGSVPLVVVDIDRKVYVEFYNGVEKEKILNFLQHQKIEIEGSWEYIGI